MMRRAHRIVLLLALLLGCAGMNYVQAQTSGSCGTNVTWSLNTSTGVLTISGSGAMTNFAGGSAPWYTNYRTTIKEVKINSGVTRIGERSFEFCENLTKVTMPNTVTSIGTCAFSGCTKLATVTLSSNLTTISQEAFYKSAITSITIPANVTSVGSSAFKECTSLKTVKFNTTKITTLPENLFNGCTALTSINIPSGVTTIGGYLCYNCSSLTSITVPNTVTTIGIGAFQGCSAMTTATLSSKLTAIPSYLFRGCTKLKTCTIPASVTTIGNNAFLDCSSLASVTIPANVTSIGEAAFSDCSSIQTVTFSGTKLTAISNNLFNSCISLKSITIPNGVTSIGNYAFRWCSSITSVSYANASKITSLGSGAFSGCTGLTSINIPANVKTIPDDLYYGCTGLTTITIPSQVTSIGLEAFRNCNSVTKVTIPVGVTTIGNYAFSISSLTDIHVSWTSSSAIPTWNNLSNTSGVKLHIPCGTGSVYRAKTGWKNYTIVGTTQYKLTVSASNSAYGSVKIGSGTASGSVSQNIYCEQEVQLTAVPKTGYHFTKWSGGSTATTNPLTIYMPSAAATYTANFAITNYTITVKTNNSGLGTVSGGGTYQEGKTATLTATPANCTSAFVQWNDGNTDNPRSFTVTENKTLTAQFVSLTGNCGASGNNLTWSLNRCTGVLTISGSGAMKDWSAVTDVPWNNYRTIITSIVLPVGLTHIGAYAFYGTGITKIDIPVAVQSFGQFAFVYSGLQEICIPEGVTTLPNNLFHHGVSITCTTPLKRIYLPSTLTTIANQAIGRHYLSTLTYPASITSLGSSIYYSGTSPVQKDVYASWPIGQIPQKPGVNFSNPPSKPNMHVPYGTKSAYGSKGWSQFYTIVEDVDERAIDVGLSIRWASCNIGATAPEESGEYYMWADTLGGWSSYVKANHPYYKNNQYTRYNATDHRTRLIPFDDAAYINWGETWRMPTKDEWHELFTQCTWEKEKLNDKWVYKVTGPNGNYIYIPLPGYKYDISLSEYNDFGTYWTSELYSSGSPIATSIGGSRNSGPADPSYGRSVRAVYRREWPSFTLTITDTPEGTPYTKAINAGSSYTLTAQEDDCHHFVQWSDGNTQNPRTVSVTADATYTAQYEDRVYSGTCGAEGDNLTWTLNACDSTLIISGTGAMKNYTYADANTVPWYYFRTYNITSIVIEEGVTDIGDYVFFACSSVTSVTIPNSVTSIGNAAFRNCSSLASITIPETVLTIGNLAFYSCPALTSITFPNSVTSIGNAALNYCSALEDIYVSWTENIPTWISMTNKDPQSSINLHIPCGTEELYNAANGWKDYTIEADIPNVKSGTYGPDNIEWTFDYCDSLLTITGNGELQCDQNTWGPNAGGINPNAVKNVFIGKGVTYLGIYTLSYMTNIEYIEIEEGHPTHRTGCNAIIRIGSEQEGDTLIFGCPHTVIPTTCTTIRGYAFWDNHRVTEMTIPSSVKQIANMQGSLWQGNNGQVFYTSNSASEGLKDLYVEWTKLEDIPAVPNNRLGDMTKVRLHVPCGTTSLYKQVTGWSQFKEYIEESATFTITVQAADPTMGDVSITVNP